MPTAVERGSADCEPSGKAHRVTKATTRPGARVRRCPPPSRGEGGAAPRSVGAGGVGEQAGAPNIPPHRVGTPFDGGDAPLRRAMRGGGRWVPRGVVFSF